MKKILKNDGFQSFVASIICILIGLLVGFIALLIIEPSGAVDGMLAIIKNFMGYSSDVARTKYFANTLVYTAPLLMCSLSILFSYKVGMFNIGAAGQYVVGVAAAIYAALILHWSWFPCMILAALAGVVWAVIVGLLKAYCNVNEVISGIMLNWIGLYITNIVLGAAKMPSSPYTYSLAKYADTAVIPSIGLDKMLKSPYAGLALPLAILFAIVIWVVLDKTKLGYELKATGCNKNAAKYAGMAEKKNIVLTLAISGGLAGLGGAFLYLTDITQWFLGANSVPDMGFNGIAAAFLGGLNPIGTIFASYFLEHIMQGGSHLDLTTYCPEVSDMISAIIIYLCGFVGFMKYVMNKRRDTKKGGEE